jgi:DNA-binding transcriptional ArsR family regulator
MSRRTADDLVFRALADGRRREILDLLKVSARTTGELCDHFQDLDRGTVMQHIGVLEKGGAGHPAARRAPALELPERDADQGDPRAVDLALCGLGG